MGHLGQSLQRTKEFRPFLAERRKLLLPCGSQPVASALAAVAACFPASANPAALLHAVEHGIQGREREAQSSLGLCLDTPRHFIAVKRTFLENAEDREFRGAALDSTSNHRALPYI